MSDNYRKREMTDVNTGAAGGAIYILWPLLDWSAVKRSIKEWL